jgi:hypothetical protein
MGIWGGAAPQPECVPRQATKEEPCVKQLKKTLVESYVEPLV